MIEHGVLEFWVFEGEDSFVDKIILLHPQPELHILSDVNERDKFTDWLRLKKAWRWVLLNILMSSLDFCLHSFKMEWNLIKRCRI